MPRSIHKAVMPVAGLGTRFLPATKSMPKEMLTVVDKPLIQYAVEEARSAGIEDIIFVTGRGKQALEDHFDHSYELESVLKDRGKNDKLDQLRALLPKEGGIGYTRQQVPLGLGHAIWCARHWVGNEPFAVLLADDLVQASVPCLKQMTEAYHKTGGNVVAVMDVPREHTNRYGIVDPGAIHGPIVEVEGLVEKPLPEEAPSTLSIIGRYILQPEIFDALEKKETGAGGEIQLTDALARQINRAGVYGYRFEGRRFDCGDKVGFLNANVAFALERDDLREGFSTFLRDLDLD